MSGEQQAYSEPSEQIAGRFVGMIVFVAGIVILVLSFILAYQAFHNPGLIVSTELLNRTPAPSPMSVYVPALLKLILLFAMGYIGSLIAARGAQMFFSAKKEAQGVSSRD